MDQPCSSQHPPTTTTENPVVAVGRKVKAALSTHQRPSIRILHKGPSRDTSRVPESRDFAEASGRVQRQENPTEPPNQLTAERSTSSSWFTNASIRAKALYGRKKDPSEKITQEHEYDSSTVDILDVLDPEVATLSTLTNVQNSLFVPQLGKFVNRRPAYQLSTPADEARIIDKLKTSLKRISSLVKIGDEKKGAGPLSNAEYAILPDGETLPGWSQQEKEELDDLVRHMLHSRRAKFKRSMKGFWQYVRRPLGLFITVYATLVTLFGAAWVFFLIGWISLGSKRDYIIDVVDNVLVALFAVIGDGLAPFRAVDTYHMIYIAYYHRKTHKRRVDSSLPDLVDRNDLPDQRKEDVEKVDIESLVARRMPQGLARIVAPRIPQKLSKKMIARNQVHDRSHEYTVLTEEEQAKLEYHERKFSKSHTFYKPHETATHYAFPLKFLIAVVVLLDCHSALQITLGACTWGIPYETRPFALTTVILCFSITCNIMGGVVISMGDKRTRKKDVIERMMRQELTAEAIEDIRTRQLKEAEERGEIDPAVRKRLEEEKEVAEKEEIKKAWKGVPLLPKHLLGKGEDHRQPPLPRVAGSSTG
ncbi:hypothetical protein PVAG01_11471 [Phlyctema vagabunda]|uniref:Integral membrane protein n=1 Tax=Phlyctema vagabunda TaxID=108571 RepID=A0ABR4P320_9HELO